jgi:PPM family protein phosphatase
MVAKTKLVCAGDSHPGKVRQNNEDRLYFDPDRGIFMVIDGIGGHAAGEKAADIALALVRARLERQTGAIEDRIREAITVANNEILQTAATNPDWHGMACVLTVAVVEEGQATVGHVGDSRLYKIRHGRIDKITHDHSPVGEREDANEISESEAMRHPRRNEVYRDVGSEEHAPEDPDFIEVQRIPFEPDGALLLCSDGLSDQVTSAEILRAVEENAGQPEEAIRELIDAANRAGGKDNVTALIVEGERFAATRPVVAAKPSSERTGNIAGSKPVIFFYGFVCASLILAGLHALGLLDTPRPPVPDAPKTLLVGAGGFPTIGEALAKARPGDTVEVSSGEYREQIRLVNGVTLKSRTPDIPILRAAELPPSPSTAILADGVKGARVSGFRILADAKAPLTAGVLIANSDLILEDTEIEGAAGGVEISGDSKPVLRANSIRDCRDAGIHISGSSTPWLLHNSIVHDGRHGVVIEDPARAVLQGNTFADYIGDPVSMPAGMDRAAVMKFNFFIPAKSPARTRGGTAR